MGIQLALKRKIKGVLLWFHSKWVSPYHGYVMSGNNYLLSQTIKQGKIQVKRTIGRSHVSCSELQSLKWKWPWSKPIFLKETVVSSCDPLLSNITANAPVVTVDFSSTIKDIKNISSYGVDEDVFESPGMYISLTNLINGSFQLKESYQTNSRMQ